MPDLSPAGPFVCVSRDGGDDWKRVLVPVAHVRGPHMAVTRGGDQQPLDAPTLAVYVDPAWCPPAWRSGEHGAGWMRMLVEAAWTDAVVLARLREAGARCVHSAEYARRRSARRRGRVHPTPG